MSAGMRSLVGSGALVGLSAATVLVLDLETDVAPEIEAPIEAPINLAAIPIDAADFGIAAPLDVRTATLKRRETLSDLVNRLDLPNNDGHRALYSLTSSELLDARRARPGMALTAHVAEESLNAISIELEAGRRLMAKRLPDGE